MLQVTFCRSAARAAGKGLLPRSTSIVAAAGLLALLAACSPAGPPVDLVNAARERMSEGSVAGRDRPWVMTQTGKQVRINDLVRRTLPASPPGRLLFDVDVPRGGRLSFACGISPERHDRPGVEFAVKVLRRGREETLWTMRLDPLQHKEHRRWVPAEVDLSPYAGRGVQLVLETKGFDRDDDPRRAFWGTPAILTPGEKAPLVVVYLVDTLRADHTQPYGYARDTTPELARFAADAVVFEQAIAQASWTKPSVASLFTSLLPGKHRAVQLRDTLDSGHVTLAEMLQAKGFATGAVIANSVIYSAGSNFEQGFDLFAGMHGAGNRVSKVVEAGPVVDEALQWLDERRGLPTFLYVHTMDPHVPYTPPEPFNMKYEPHPTPEHPAVDPRGDYKEPADLDRLIAQYDGEIAYGDRELGRFISELKRRGLYDRALMVFMGDHGEEFLDHGQFTHGKTVFDELIHIPLIVKFPDRRDGGKRVRQQVQEVDVLPTVLQELGLPVPQPPAIAGHPLQPVVAGGAPEPPAVSEISHRGYVAHGMRTSRDKYVQRFSPEEDELYFDLQQDPKEKTSTLAANRPRADTLKAAVEAAMVADPFRHNIRAEGGGDYVLKLRTGGWIEGVEPKGFTAEDHYEIQGNGRKLALRLRPRPGQPREVAFGIRPMGAPVYLEGSRDGRPLRTADVTIAEEAEHPPEVPFRLPEVEPRGDTDDERFDNVFAPPRGNPAGLQLWLTMAPGAKVLNIDKETRERLCALGYINCGKK
jgi:arylsulfatase A-like enzyme